MRPSALLVVTSALAVGLAACVLFVPSPDETAGATCGLTSDEKSSSCGSCLASKCQSALDRCCAEGRSCESAIPSVVLCEEDDETCAAAGDGGAEAVLRACALEQCRTTCGDGQVPDRDAAPKPSVTCRTSDDSCSCAALTDAGSSSGTCTSTSSISKPCCADEGYPTTPGTFCACRQRFCQEVSGTRCVCGYGTERPSSPATTCRDTLRVCCRTEDGTSCSCDTTWDECPSPMVPTSSCSASELSCLVDSTGKTAKMVSTCSP